MKNSNCLIEALKAWVRQPFKTRIRLSKTNKMHFYWVNPKGRFHFCPARKNLPAMEAIWFEGKVKRYIAQAERSEM